MNSYDLPRAYERETLARQMAKLTKRQRRAARSYVRNVEAGEMILKDWLASEVLDSPAESSWRKPFSKGGNYWGTELDDPQSPFRTAVRMLIEGEESWKLSEEQKAVKEATHIYRVNAPNAAKVHVALLEHPDPKERRLAAKEVADRAGVGVEATSGGLQPIEPAFVQQMIDRIYGSGGEEADDGVDDD